MYIIYEAGRAGDPSQSVRISIQRPLAEIISLSCNKSEHLTTKKQLSISARSV